MSSFRWGIVVIALASMGATSVVAATDEDLRQIRREIESLKANYEARIQALEKKLLEAESRVAAQPPTTTPTRPTASNAFNPAISAVLQGRYANLSRDDSPSGPRGFSLAESEVTLSANVDQKFAGVLTLALTPEDTVSVEEAYGALIAPVHGASAKFGRFLSGIGYMNEQHAHVWDFVDAPLAYEAFFGGQYRNDGVQAKWVAPTEHYLEIGGEAGNGVSFPGADRNKNGVGSGALFAHTGGDLGTSHSWRAGLSFLRTRDDNDRLTKIGIADFVWKWAPEGNARERNFKLQGEYFRQEQEGWKPRGAYVQAVYQFMPRWRVGARYDWLDIADSKRSSVMLDWSPSEFSRVRFQFARSQTQPDLTDNQFFVQYILNFGAHGAHRY